MIGIEHVFLAVGFAAGVCFATFLLTASIIYDEYRTNKDQERR